MKKQKTFLLSFSIMCTIISAMESDYLLVEQTTQKSSTQQHIQSLFTKKRITGALYGALVLGTATAAICNVIWEEPTLQSDYFGANVLSIGNKINTAATLGLGFADIIWLIKSHCAFSNDASQEDTWTDSMAVTHASGGASRSVVAILVGIGGGIRRYPQTLTMLAVTGLLDFAGLANIKSHENIDKEIKNLQSKSQ